MCLTLIWAHLRLEIRHFTGKNSDYSYTKSKKLCLNGFYIIFNSIVFILYIVDIVILVTDSAFEAIICALSMTAISNIIALVIVWITGLGLIREIES